MFIHTSGIKISPIRQYKKRNDMKQCVHGGVCPSPPTAPLPLLSGLLRRFARSFSLSFPSGRPASYADRIFEPQAARTVPPARQT